MDVHSRTMSGLRNNDDAAAQALLSFTWLRWWTGDLGSRRTHQPLTAHDALEAQYAAQQECIRQLDLPGLYALLVFTDGVWLLWLAICLTSSLRCRGMLASTRSRQVELRVSRMRKVSSAPCRIIHPN
jgi:hypothetical protein